MLVPPPPMPFLVHLRFDDAAIAIAPSCVCEHLCAARVQQQLVS